MGYRTAVSFRWGQLITAVEAARSSVHLATRCADLLGPEDRERLQHAAELLAAIEQRAWKTKS